MLLPSQISAEETLTTEPAAEAREATRYVEAAEPSAAAATFVRPPPAFRLATTSLWVPTHASDQRASSGSDRGEGSGRGPHAVVAGDGSDSIEATSTPVAAAPPHAYIPSDPSVPDSPSDDLLSRNSARFGDGDGSSSHQACEVAGTPGETRLAPWRIVGQHYRGGTGAQVRLYAVDQRGTSYPRHGRATCLPVCRPAWNVSQLAQDACSTGRA